MSEELLHLKDATPQAAFEALGKASHSPLPPQPQDLFEQGPWPTADVDFTRELTTLGIAHTYRLVYGGHNWALWRNNAKLAYRAAATRLAG